MRVVEKPWGHEEIWAHTDKYVGKNLVIEAGKRLSLQSHVTKDETIYVAEGSLILEIGPSADNLVRQLLEAGEAAHIPPGTVHRFSAELGSCTLVEVSTPELDDVVRYSDDYGRVL